MSGYQSELDPADPLYRDGALPTPMQPQQAPTPVVAPSRGALGNSAPQRPLAAAMDHRQQSKDLYDPTKVEVDMTAPAMAGTGGEHRPGYLWDTFKQAQVSAEQMGEGLVGAVSAATRALSSDPDAVAFVERQRRAIADHIEHVTSTMSPEAQEAMKASLFQAGAKGPSDVGWGRYASATVAGAIPQLALALVPGGVWGRVASAVAFGGIGSGEAYNQLVDGVDQATEEQLRQSPVYMHLRDTGVSDTEARKQLVGQLAPVLMGSRFALDAAAGAGLGTLLTRGAMGAAGRGALGRAGIGAAEGGATMGTQAAGDTALQQQAEQKAGMRDSVSGEDIARAFASGALGGGIMGGAAGAVHGPGRKATPDAPSATDPMAPAGPVNDRLTRPNPYVLPELSEALSDTLNNGQQPRGQSNLFLPHEMGPAPNPTDPGGMPMRQPDMFGGPEQQVGPSASPPRPLTPDEQRERMFTQQPRGPETPQQPGALQRGPEQLEMFVRPQQSPEPQAMPTTQPDMFGAPDQRVAPPASSAPGPEQVPLMQSGGTKPVAVTPVRAGRPAPKTPTAPAEASPAPAKPPAGAAPPVPPGATAEAKGVVPAGAKKARSPAQIQREEGVGYNEAAKRSNAEKKALAARTEPVAEPIKGAQDAAAVIPEAAPVAEAQPSPATVPPKAASVGDKLKSAAAERRAAQKAKLAAPGPRVKGTGHIAGEGAEAPEPPPVASKAVDRPGAERVLAAEKVPPAVMKRVLDAIDNLMSLTKGTPDEQRTALREWAKKQPQALPGTKLRLSDMADTVSRQHFGKGLMDEAGRGRAEAAQDRNRSGSNAKETDSARAGEGTAREQEAEAHASPEDHNPMSEGVTVYHPELAGERRTQDKQRVAGDLLHEVSEGTKTPEEAAIEYGGPADTGAKRTHATFRDFVSAMKARYADPKVAARLVKELAAVEDTSKRGQARTGATRTADAIRRELALTTEEGQTRLERAVKALDDPDTAGRVSAALDEAKVARIAERKQAQAEANRSGLKPDTIRSIDTLTATQHDRSTMRALLRVFQSEDPAGQMDRMAALHGVSREDMRKANERLNAAIEKDDGPIIDYLNERLNTRDQTLFDVAREGRAETGSPELQNALEAKLFSGGRSERGAASLHEMLDLIAKHEGTPPGLAEVAAKFRQHVPDLDVRNTGTPRGVVGTYTAAGEGPAFIRVAPASSGKAETIVHEAGHALFHKYLDAAIKNKRQDITGPLAAIHNQLARIWNDESHPQHYAARGASDVDYALSSLHELTTMIWSNAELQTLMRKIQPDAEFKAAMGRWGYPITKLSSIWKAFTDSVRRMMGLGPKVSDNLLDHVIHPMSDFLHDADRFNRQRGDADIWKATGDREAPAMLGRRDPTSVVTARDKAMETVEKVMRYADLPNVPAKFRPALLQAATSDIITARYRKLFQPSDRLTARENPLEAYRKSQEATAHTVKAAHDEYTDRVNDVAKKLVGKPHVAELMNDATIAEARLGTSDPAANAHFRTEAELDQLKALQDRFAALTPDEQTAYKEARALHEEWYRKERAARVDALLANSMPDLTDDQRVAIKAMLRTRKGLDEFLANPDAGPIADKFRNEWEAKRPIAQGIAKLHRVGWVRGDYFPLRRSGDYVVHYGDPKTENYGVEMFERHSEAVARREELLAQGADDVSQVMTKREHTLAEMAPDHPAIADLEAAMRRNPDLRDKADTVRDMAMGILMDYATHAEQARTRMRRRGIQGAQTNAAQVLAKSMLQHAYGMGTVKHSVERNDALSSMRLVRDDLGRHGKPGEQITANAVLKELERRLATGDDSSSKISGAATQLGYVQSLMSFSHVLVNTIEAHMNSTAMLGARHGNIQSTLAIGKALAQVAPKLTKVGASTMFKSMSQGLRSADWNMGRYAQERLVAAGADAKHMDKLFGGLEQAGLIDHTLDRELQRIANPTGVATTGVGRAWQRFLDFNGAMAHASDVANKAAIAKAAFDLELRKNGGNVQGAVDHAVDISRKVMPNYNPHNKARIATTRGALGKFGPTLMQFKNYGLHMYGVMANLAKESFDKTSSAAERSEARKAFAGVMVTHALMAGGMTWIADPLRYLGGAYDWAFGDDDKPHDYQNDVRGWLADMFGPTVGEIMARGLPHAAGIDIHNRVGLNNMLSVPELKSFDKKGFMEMIAAGMTGAAGEDAAAIAGGLSKMMHGDIGGGITDALPRVARDVAKAIRMSGDEGLTDPRGKTILPADKISLYDLAVQSAGFQPSVVSEAREGRQAVQEAMTERRDARSKLVQKWLRGNADGRADVMSDIREWNAEHPAQRITMQQLLSEANQRKKGSPEDFGLRLPRKGAAEFRDAGRFANTGG